MPLNHNFHPVILWVADKDMIILEVKVLGFISNYGTFQIPGNYGGIFLNFTITLVNNYHWDGDKD